MAKELDKTIKVSWGLLQTLVIALVVSTFTVTKIYDKFEYAHLEQKVLKDRIEYVNDRINRKADPIEKAIITLKEDYYQIRIRELEEELKTLRSDQ